MASSYVLEQRVIGPHKVLDIDEQRYFSLVKARSVLSDALAFEQGYELLLGNFIEMEMGFSEISLRAMLETDHQHQTLAGALRDANRRVINVLTAMRGYVDQAPQMFKALDLTPKFSAVVRTELNDMHAASLDYQFIYDLRNYVQHKGAAIHGYEVPLVLEGDGNGWAEAVLLHTLKDQLTTSDFKESVLAELPDKIDIRRRIRMSLLALGGVHLKLRALVAPRVDAARAAIDTAIQVYRDVGAESVIGLAARRVGDKAADVPLLVDWDEIRRKLVEKNSRSPQLWPRASHREPHPADIVSLRTSLGHTVAEAARHVFVSAARWSDWEAGLPMPEGLFNLYQLQVGRHQTHELVPLASPSTTPEPALAAAPDQG